MDNDCKEVKSVLKEKLKDENCSCERLVTEQTLIRSTNQLMEEVQIGLALRNVFINEDSLCLSCENNELLTKIYDYSIFLSMISGLTNFVNEEIEPCICSPILSDSIKGVIMKSGCSMSLMDSLTNLFDIGCQKEGRLERKKYIQMLSSEITRAFIVNTNEEYTGTSYGTEISEVSKIYPFLGEITVINAQTENSLTNGRILVDSSVECPLQYSLDNFERLVHSHPGHNSMSKLIQEKYPGKSEDEIWNDVHSLISLGLYILSEIYSIISELSKGKSPFGGEKRLIEALINKAIVSGILEINK